MTAPDQLAKTLKKSPCLQGEATYDSKIASALSSADAFLSRLETFFITGGLAFACCLLFANVVGRYLFLAPIGWAEEVSLYLIVWMVFVGGSVAIRTRGHIAMDLLPLWLSSANRRRLTLFTSWGVIIFLAVFFYYSLAYTLRARASGQVTPLLQAPIWLAFLAMPVGSGLMIMRMCQFVWRTFRNDHRPFVDLQD
ncbi:MAG: TRAP transporter small permease [Ktedonobacteraceae bacterium]